MSKEISQKHKQFCHELVKNGGNARKAYQSIYNVDDKKADASASRLLTNVKVKEYLASLADPIKEKVTLTIEKVLEDIAKIKKLALDRKVGKKKSPDLKNALKAVELEGKYLKMFTEKLEITNPDGNMGVKIYIPDNKRKKNE